ncbi:MAG: hypothetical protein K1X54_13200 [Flavobacteriales bacterium]|nr:hypothetical protein [Flavobacteriales bacterium]
MKKIFTLSLFVLWIGAVMAQTCSGDLFFASQQELNDFLINNPTCTAIDGNVVIVNSISDSDPILDVQGLQNIQTISGDVTFQLEVGPMSFTGLSSLTSVGGNLIFDDYTSLGNPNAIVSYDGLQNLVAANGLSLSVIGGMDLTVFDQFTTAENITINITGTGNISITDIFPGITELNGGFYFQTIQATLIDFSGLNNLVTAGHVNFQPGFGVGQVSLGSIDAFNQLDSCTDIYFDLVYVNDVIGLLENLRAVSNSLWLDLGTDGTNYPQFSQLESTPSLNVLMGGQSIPPLTFPSLVECSYILISAVFSEVNFPLLESVGTMMINGEEYQNPIFAQVNAPMLNSIQNEFQLGGLDVADLSGFASLDFIGGAVTITNCPNLSDCAISAMCDKVSVDAGNVNLDGNAVGCNTVGEILDACAIGYVTGSVYADLNCDGEFNTGDVPFSNAIIHNESNLPVGNSYNDGTYYVGLADNTTTTIHAMNQLGFLPGSSYTLTTTTTNEVFSNYDFPLCPDVNYHDVSSYGYGGNPRPGFYQNNTLLVTNHSANTEYMVVTADLSLLPGASVSSTDGVVSGSTITWTVNELSYNQTMQFNYQIYVSPTAVLGTTYTYSYSVNLLNGVTDLNPADNVFSYNRVVSGSYDPNDKSVNRAAIDVAEIPADDGVWLDYTIRFQNTGTAEAITVRVEDVIAENLDLSTFQPLDASHVFDLSFDVNRKVEWLFNNIMLPDSNTNEPESHGFIHFRIKTIPGLGIADVIENNAAIYFDFNEPVITNTATTIFYECTQNAEIAGIADVCEGSDALLNASGNWDEYLWTIDGNVVGTSNQLIMDNLSAGQQTIALHVSDSYCSDDAEFVLDVTPIPSTPVITQSGNTLTASGNGIFTWTLNGETLADNDNSIEITESGVYGVSVMETMCVSEVTSGEFEFVGVKELKAEEFLTCYPNPASNILHVLLPANWVGKNNVMVVDGMGRRVLSSSGSSMQFTLDVNTLERGCYHIEVLNEESQRQLYEMIIIE